MAKASNSSYAISIDIAEALVMKERLPFRTAHILVGSLVNKAFKKKSSLKSLDIAEIKEILQNLKISIAPDKLIRIIKETDSQEITIHSSISRVSKSQGTNQIIERISNAIKEVL